MEKEGIKIEIEEVEGEEEEETEVFEIEIAGISYYTADEVNGSFYAKTSDDDIGDEVGEFVNGKPKFH